MKISLSRQKEATMTFLEFWALKQLVDVVDPNGQRVREKGIREKVELLNIDYGALLNRALAEALNESRKN